MPMGKTVDWDAVRARPEWDELQHMMRTAKRNHLLRIARNILATLLLTGLSVIGLSTVVTECGFGSPLRLTGCHVEAGFAQAAVGPRYPIP